MWTFGPVMCRHLLDWTNFYWSGLTVPHYWQWLEVGGMFLLTIGSACRHFWGLNLKDIDGGVWMHVGRSACQHFRGLELIKQDWRVVFVDHGISMSTLQRSRLVIHGWGGNVCTPNLAWSILDLWCTDMSTCKTTYMPIHNNEPIYTFILTSPETIAQEGWIGAKLCSFTKYWFRNANILYLLICVWINLQYLGFYMSYQQSENSFMELRKKS